MMASSSRRSQSSDESLERERDLKLPYSVEEISFKGSGSHKKMQISYGDGSKKKVTNLENTQPYASFTTVSPTSANFGLLVSGLRALTTFMIGHGVRVNSGKDCWNRHFPTHGVGVAAPKGVLYIADQPRVVTGRFTTAIAEPATQVHLEHAVLDRRRRVTNSITLQAHVVYRISGPGSHRVAEGTTRDSMAPVRRSSDCQAWEFEPNNSPATPLVCIDKETKPGSPHLWGEVLCAARAGSVLVGARDRYGTMIYRIALMAQDLLPRCTQCVNMGNNCQCEGGNCGYNFDGGATVVAVTSTDVRSRSSVRLLTASDYRKFAKGLRMLGRGVSEKDRRRASELARVCNLQLNIAEALLARTALGRAAVAPHPRSDLLASWNFGYIVAEARPLRELLGITIAAGHSSLVRLADGASVGMSVTSKGQLNFSPHVGEKSLTYPAEVLDIDVDRLDLLQVLAENVDVNECPREKASILTRELHRWFEDWSTVVAQIVSDLETNDIAAAPAVVKQGLVAGAGKLGLANLGQLLCTYCQSLLPGVTLPPALAPAGTVSAAKPLGGLRISGQKEEVLTSVGGGPTGQAEKAPNAGVNGARTVSLGDRQSVLGAIRSLVDTRWSDRLKRRGIASAGRPCPASRHS